MRIFRIIEILVVTAAVSCLVAKCVTQAFPSSWLFFSFAALALYYLLFSRWIFVSGIHKYYSVFVSIFTGIGIALCLMGWIPDVFSWPKIFPFFPTGAAILLLTMIYEFLLRDRWFRQLPAEGKSNFRRDLLIRTITVLLLTGFLAIGPRDIVYAMVKMKNPELRLFEYVGKLLEARNPAQARTVMERHFSDDPFPQTQRLYGEVLLANGDTAGALKKFQLSLMNDTFDHAVSIGAANIALLDQKDKWKNLKRLNAAANAPYDLYDGWKAATAASQSVSQATIDEYFRYGEKIPSLVGLMVVKNDKVIAEQYYQYGPLHLNATFSVWKSIVSAMCGAAIAKGYIKNIDQGLSDFFPEYPYHKNDPRPKITVRQLLTMTSGITGNDYGKYWNEKDPLHSILDNPIAPGNHFFYLTQNMILTIKIIERTSRTRFDKFCQQVCDTMRILQPYYPDSALQQVTSKITGANPFSWDGTYLTLRDMAKFGSLFLHDGNYKGKQIVPKEWMMEATRVQHSFDASEKKDYTQGFDGYGYYFWIKNIAGHPCFMSRGWGGQSILCVPDKNLMVLSFGSEWDKSGGFAIEKLVLNLAEELCKK